MNLNQFTEKRIKEKFLEERMQRIMLIIEATTKKIIRKEFKKLQRDIIKGMLQNGVGKSRF